MIEVGKQAPGLRTGEPFGWNQIHAEPIQRPKKRHVSVLSARLDTDLNQGDTGSGSSQGRVQGL